MPQCSPPAPPPVDDSPTSLERPETNRQTPVYGPSGVHGEEVSLSQTFRHSGWRRERQMVYAALVRTSQGLSRVKAFADCGNRSYVYRSDGHPPQYKIGGSACHDRWCVPCATDRSRLLAANIVDALRGARSRFVTLTLRSTDSPLADQVQRLYRSFAALRKTRTWREVITGGCAVCEVTYSASREQWHPHLHVLCNGKYIPQQALAAAWLRVTGDSHIVDVRLVRSRQDAGRYVAKYVSKPLSNTFVARPDRLDEVITALKGKRLCLTFGDWRGIALLERPESGNWEPLGPLVSVLYDALDGQAEARKAIAAIAGGNADAWLKLAAQQRPPPTMPTARQRQGLLNTLWRPPE